MESGNERSLLEREPRPSRGSAAPIFERLTSIGDPAREETRPLRSFDAAEAQESVRRELRRLLNTRALPVSVAAGDRLTTTEYGLPDFAHISPGDIQARNDLAALLTRTIEAFESRLQNVRVILEPHPSCPRSLTGAILANMVIGVIAEPVSFPLELQTRSWAADLKTPEPSESIV
ncbi:MAG TPA: type VI secretion system baseplate subunit TssE [Bryobacteraceae bacterium]|jgi:type VI secretion system lysozyme-like protein|nr:type VI secretion system baseplate subunit TssE [Bryobacteraceae bacterium]